MAAHRDPDPTPSMLARLRGTVPEPAPAAGGDAEETLPTWDVSLDVPVGAADSIPVALPADLSEALPAAPADGGDDIPMAQPAEPLEGPEPPAEAVPAAEPVALPPCPHCQAPRKGNQAYCDDCGLVFPPDVGEVPAAPPAPAGRATLLKGRYELGARVAERGDVVRCHGLDRGLTGAESVPVVLLRAPLPPAGPPDTEAEPAPPENAVGDEDEDVLPGFDEVMFNSGPATEVLPRLPPWPGVAWEDAVLTKALHPALPAAVDRFAEDGWEYLVEDVPTGRPLWDAWDDPEASADRRFGWLEELAEGLHVLHLAGAVLEALRPEMVVITPEGQARLTDLGDLLPLPLPAGAALRGTPYTAPELVLDGERADARAALYGFGALLYSLVVGRELTETDFERDGVPKPFIPQFPDVHPVLGRLLSKTFCRDVAARFPTDEAGREDPSGFTDLLRTLRVCQRTLDLVRLEVAAWTTTGMVRTGNEDAFALLHAVESRQDDLGESTLVLLADGMGGTEAGEVAAALAIQALRGYLLAQPMFALLAGRPVADQAPFQLETCQRLLREALNEANTQVLAAARDGDGRQGMGCTAEVVYVNGQHVVVGHVGDSRTYHLHDGRLVQLTRDQTLVNRLMELGTLTPEEAEKHPRRSELQQAIGGHAEVDPALYHGALRPGDWVVVCSDGLSNHVTPAELQQMLQEEATSAEMAARRLVNLANIKGATDNATVVVVRAL
jgi:serine/threonine protein phosphatase PrpC